MSKFVVMPLIIGLVGVLGILVILDVNISAPMINQIPTTKLATTLTIPTTKPTTILTTTTQAITLTTKPAPILITTTQAITLTTKPAAIPTITPTVTLLTPTDGLAITSITLVKASSETPVKAVNNSNSMMITDQIAGTVTSVHKISPKKIAYVSATFTHAAYNNAFYVFYHKYGSIPKGQLVTTDLNLLTATFPNQIVENYHNRNIPIIRQQLGSIEPGSNFTVVTDVNVDNGLIFDKSGPIDVAVIWN